MLGKLGNYLEISSRIFKCSLTKSMFSSLFLVQYHFPQRKQINSRTCKFYFHSFFLPLLEVLTGMLRGFLTNLGMLHLVLGEKNLTQLKLQRCQPSKQFCEVGFCRRKKLQTEVWMFD